MLPTGSRNITGMEYLAILTLLLDDAPESARNFHKRTENSYQKV